MPEVHIRTSEVKRMLAKLDMKKSSEPDGIPAIVLKICSSPLATGHWPNVCIGVIEIARSETLDVLGTSIRSDLPWDDHALMYRKKQPSV